MLLVAEPTRQGIEVPRSVRFDAGSATSPISRVPATAADPDRCPLATADISGRPWNSPSANDYAGLHKLNAAKADHLVVPDAPRPDDMTATQAVDQFARGRVLFTRNWAVAHEQLTKRQRELDAAGITSRSAAPPSQSVLGGQNLAISAATDKPRAAQALIEFLTSTQSQLILSEIGGFAPTRDSVYERATSEHVRAVRQALQNARPRPTIPFYTEFSRTFRNGVKNVAREGDRISDATLQELTEIYQRRVKPGSDR